MADAAVFPLSKSERTSSVQVGDGTTTTFGPYAFQILDFTDVEVWRKDQNDPAFWIDTSVTVTKTSSAELSSFVIVFPYAPPSTTQFYVDGARTPSRTAGISYANRIDFTGLDLEFTRIAISQQEQRRELSRTVKAERGVTPPTFIETPEAGRTIVFDDDGNLINGPDLSGIAGIAETAAAAQAAAATAIAAAGGVTIARVANTTALKAINQVTYSTAIDESTGFMWSWRAGDYSASIAADTDGNSFIKANAVAATAGAWLRMSPGVPPLIADRGIRFDRYRARYGTDTAAFKAMIYDAFRTAADAYAAFIDLCGMTLRLTEPIDVAVVTGRTTNYKTVTFCNGTLFADNSLGLWVSSGISRSTSINIFSDVHTVASTATLEVGMCVLRAGGDRVTLGTGIARETYVTEIISATQYRTNTRAYRTLGAVYFVSRKFPYFLTFKGFTTCSRVKFIDMNFRCEGLASGIQMAQGGNDWVFHNLHFLAVGDRLITDFKDCSSGCETSFVVAWANDTAETRGCYGVLMSTGDAKMSNCRIINFLASFVGHGGGYTINKCHNWQGGSTVFKRQSAFLFTNPSPFVALTGSYIDNGGVEISNENVQTSGAAFNNIVIDGCEFTFSSNAELTSRYVTLSICGYTGLDASGVTQNDTALRGIDGFSLQGCCFRKLVGGGGTGVLASPTAVDVYGTGGLDPAQIKNLFWNAIYYNVTNQEQNPATLAVTKTTAADTWGFDFANRLPFGLKPQTVRSTQHGGKAGMKTAGDVLTPCYSTTYVDTPGTTVKAKLNAVLKGTVTVTVDAGQFT